MSRPRAVLGMSAGMADHGFTPPQRQRLSELVELLAPQPVESWDALAPATLAEVEIVVGHWGCPLIDSAALALLPKLRLVAYGAGSVKNTITADVLERGIVVTTAAAVNAVPVAEYTLGVILLANKGVFVSRERLRDPTISVVAPAVVGNLHKRIGVIGASRTGRHLIELLRPFDLEVVVYDPYLTDEEASTLGVTGLPLDELLRTSDVVSVHAPWIAATEGMIGAPELAAMKDGAVFVNTARGRLVDTAALLTELRTGRISAVLDVTWPEPLPADSPLLHLPNAFVTPHVAGSMGTELERLGAAAIEEVARYTRGEPPAHPVRAAEFEQMA